jgi:hypothetical protein
MICKATAVFIGRLWSKSEALAYASKLVGAQVEPESLGDCISQRRPCQCWWPSRGVHSSMLLGAVDGTD